MAPRAHERNNCVCELHRQLATGSPVEMCPSVLDMGGAASPDLYRGVGDVSGSAFRRLRRAAVRGSRRRATTG